MDTVRKIFKCQKDIDDYLESVVNEFEAIDEYKTGKTVESRLKAIFEPFKNEMTFPCVLVYLSEYNDFYNDLNPPERFIGFLVFESWFQE